MKKDDLVVNTLDPVGYDKQSIKYNSLKKALHYIRLLIKNNASRGLLISFSLILAGALGNIIDSAFYGLIFSESSYHGGVATMFPVEGGYSSFLQGKVVDMLYFPVFHGYFPEWFPIWSGKPYLFFKPVFNLADMAITIGVLNILFFQRGFFGGKAEDENPPTEEDKEENGTTETEESSPLQEQISAEDSQTQ